jgi:hypothetical protein
LYYLKHHISTDIALTSTPRQNYERILNKCLSTRRSSFRTKWIMNEVSLQKHGTQTEKQHLILTSPINSYR